MNKTIAETISHRFHTPGQDFTDIYGHTLEEICGKAAANIEKGTMEIDDWTRYRFRDNSAIIMYQDNREMPINGDAWDFGFPDCSCGQSTGHTADCSAINKIQGGDVAAAPPADVYASANNKEKQVYEK